jgi:hypothetical protein
MTSAPELRFHQMFDHPQGIDASHAAFSALQGFVRGL